MESANEIASNSSNNDEVNVDFEEEDSQSTTEDYASDDDNDYDRTFPHSWGDFPPSRVAEKISKVNRHLFRAVKRNDAATVRRAIQNGADVNYVRTSPKHRIQENHAFQTLWRDDIYDTPLLKASKYGFNEIIRILLDAGANVRWEDNRGRSALLEASMWGRLSIVGLLLDHDNDLLDMADNVHGWTPLLVAVRSRQLQIVQFLLQQGANTRVIDLHGYTTLMYATTGNLEIARLLLAAGVEVDAREDHSEETALHFAASSDEIELLRILILEHNANMFSVDSDGRTPFDHAIDAEDSLLQWYGSKLTEDHGRLALHALLAVAEYLFAEEGAFMERTEYGVFHPPLMPLRIILPLGKLVLEHFSTLLVHSLDAESIRTRDDIGKLPIHIACQTKAPVEVLSMLVMMDPVTLQMADRTGALPIHLLCDRNVVEYASSRFLVEQGGVGTLAARTHDDGALPLHLFCGSIRPEWRTLRFLMQSFPGSVTARTNDGQYPFMIAACESSSASLSVVYELVRANPSLVVPNEQ